MTILVVAIAVVVVLAIIGVMLITNPDLLGGEEESPGILVTHPTSGNSHEAGSICPIRWSSTGDIGADVRIEYGYQGGLLMTAIVASTTNNGSYDWTIPLDVEPRNNYYIFITSKANESIYDSSDYFSITAQSGVFDDPQVGDFVAYTSNYGVTMRFQVTIVNETNCTVMTMASFGTFVGYSNKTYNKSAAFTGEFDPNNMPPESAIEYTGKESISTPYGSRNCDKWHMTSTESSGAADIWYYYGILIKMSATSPGTQQTAEITLSDTNLLIIING
jgi:hypothetical protein